MTSILKSMKFTELPARGVRDLVARVRIMERLAEQKELLSNPAHTRKFQRYRGKGADRTVVEITQKIRPWWRTTPSGVAFAVYLGSTPVFFAKDKPAIAVGSMAELPSLIDALTTAVKNGEMDEVIKSTLASRKPRAKDVPAPQKVRKAA